VTLNECVATCGGRELPAAGRARAARPRAVRLASAAIVLVLALVRPALAGPAPVIGLTGRYAEGYRTLLRAPGAECESLAIGALTNAAALSRFDLVVLSHLGRALSDAESEALGHYVEQGGTALLELHTAWPQRIPGTVTVGHAPDVRPVQADHELVVGLATRDAPPVFRYRAWGAGIATTNTANRTIVARWNEDPNAAYAHRIAAGFAAAPAALLDIRLGAGRIVWTGTATTVNRDTHPLAARLLTALLGKERLPLLGLEQACIQTPVTVATHAVGVTGLTIGIFSEPGFPSADLPADVTPPWIEQSLQRAGYAVTLLGADILCDAALLTPQRYRAVVLSYGSRVPSDALLPLKRYLAAGGGIVSPAGQPLARPCLLRAGRWVDLDDADPPVAAAYIINRQVLPLGKTYTPQGPIAGTVVLDDDALPGLPRWWPLTGDLYSFIHRTDGARTQQRPLLASVGSDGSVQGLPLVVTGPLTMYPAGRLVALGFSGPAHPWSPGAWEHAEQAVCAVVALALPRDEIAIEDVMTDLPLYRPGETVTVSVALRCALPREERLTVRIRPRDGESIVHEVQRLVSIAPGALSTNTITWTVPASPAPAYDIVARAGRAGEATLCLVDTGPEPTVEFDMADGCASVDGRPTWISGVNLYVDDIRGVGPFFRPECRIGQHPLVDLWDRDLSLCRLLGGNAVRQHYYEKMFDDAAALTGDSVRTRTLDAFHRLLARHNVVVFANPLTFKPLTYWRERLGNADPDAYRDPRYRSETFAYLRALGGRLAAFRNIAWEIINEPEAYCANDSTSRRMIAHTVQEWTSRARSHVVDATGRPVGLGHAYSTRSVCWSPRGNLRHLDWSNVHCYSAEHIEAQRGTAFGLNFGRPCLVGEAGMPDGASSPTVFLGTWAGWYDQLLCTTLAERGMGFQNFYLSNSLRDADAPEWGLIRDDGTEKAGARVWAQWNAVVRRLPPESYVPSTLGLFLSHAARLDDPSILAPVHAIYYTLLRRGIHARIVSEYDIEEAPPLERLIVPAVCRDHVPERWQSIATPWAHPVNLTAWQRVAYDGIPAELRYALPKRDGGMTVVLVDGSGNPSTLHGPATVEFTVPKGRCAVLDFLPNGRLRLFSGQGAIAVDGRRLAESPNAYALFADGASLHDGTVTVWSDDPASVVTDLPACRPVSRLDGGTIVLGHPRFERAAQRMASTFRARGIDLAITQQPGAAGRVLIGRYDDPVIAAALRQRRDVGVQAAGGLPTLRMGDMRVRRPWSGVILYESNAGNPSVVATGLTDAAVDIAAMRLARLRQLGNYSTAPFVSLDDATGFGAN
jgi:hypothetical protein